MSATPEPIVGTLIVHSSGEQLNLTEIIKNPAPTPPNRCHAWSELNDLKGNSEKHGTNQVTELDGYRALLTRLDSDPVRAWQAHEDLRKKLIAYFEYNHHLEADELAEEVLDRISRRSDLQVLRNIVEFAFGVARNLRKQTFRQTSMRTEVPDIESLADTRGGDGSMEDTLINYISAKKKLECFQQCLESLSVKDREVVRRYYPAENGDLEWHRLTLACDLGITVGALRTRIARIKEKLQDDFNRYCDADHRRKVRESRNRVIA